MQLSDIRYLFAFDRWATRRVLAATVGIDETTWSAPNPIGERGLGGILVHALGAHQLAVLVRPLGAQARLEDRDLGRHLLKGEFVQHGPQPDGLGAHARVADERPWDRRERRAARDNLGLALATLPGARRFNLLFMWA